VIDAQLSPLETDFGDPGPRERLMSAAEVHIAQAGLSVSLRDIALGAGIRNNSAVNYHFGDREGLIEAIVLTRAEHTEQARVQGLAELPEDASLRDLVSLLVVPLLTVPYDEGATHYARFLDQVRSHWVFSRGMEDPKRFPVSREILRRIGQQLDLPSPVRKRRLVALSTALFALAADRERALADQRPAYEPDEVTDMLVGLLGAA
jgi:AcrR family transcriptional regulator